MAERNEICPSCGGRLGRDCFNTGECAAISADMAQRPGPADSQPWRPTHRHVKRGSAYEVLSEQATLQASEPIADETMMVVYADETGRWWVRSAVEFFDGRFEPMETAHG